MFDQVELTVRAGNGGDGAVAFRRERYAPFGGPSGGDGGKGGNVIITAENRVSTLRAYKHKRLHQAENGQKGETQKRHGGDGADLVLNVPPGTVIHQHTESGEDIVLADLEVEGDEVVVARGGRGGWGNVHYASSTNQAPRVAQKGEPGEEKLLVLELRLIADAGVIGLPNVGKSSLLAAVSAAKPVVADYPFTTLEPVLGVVEVGKESFILAEIPGLVEGASQGKGLGLDFLKHATRTRVLIHLLDGSSADPAGDLLKVNAELNTFNPILARKSQIIAINKIDIPAVRDRVNELKESFIGVGLAPFFVSASTGEGLSELMEETARIIKSSVIRTKVMERSPQKVFRPKPVDLADRVRREGVTFIVADSKLESMMDRVDLTEPADRQRFYQELEKMGIGRSLRKAGAKSGDVVRTGHKEFKWYENEYRNYGRDLRPDS